MSNTGQQPWQMADVTCTLSYVEPAPAEPGPSAALYTASFGAGVVGEKPDDQMASPRSSTTYSDDITGPYGDPTTCRVSIGADASYFGGRLTDAPPGFNIAEGDTVWARIWHYIPSSFCAGSSGGTEPEPPVDFIKWLRFQWGTAGGGSRLTFQPRTFTGGECNSNGPTVGGAQFEQFADGSNRWFPNQANIKLPRDQWFAWQWSFKIHETEGYIRCWIDDTFIGEVGPSNTIPNQLAAGLNQIVLGDYWNNKPFQTNHWYIDDIIITKDEPSTLDAGGRPYIAPATRASDFDGAPVDDLPEPTLFRDDFESANMWNGSGGYSPALTDLNNCGFAWYDNNKTSVVTMTGPGEGLAVWNNGPISNAVSGVDWTAKEGDYSLRFRYAAGDPNAEQYFSFMGNQYPELWFRYWLRVPLNFHHGSLNNKFFSVFPERSVYDSEGTFTLQTRPSSSGGGSARLVVQDGGVISGEAPGLDPFITVPDDRGRWMQMAVRVKWASAQGANDGVIQVYRRWDGESSFTKVYEKLNAVNQWREGYSGYGGGFILSWANDPYVEQTEWLLDVFEVSDEPLVPEGDI